MDRHRPRSPKVIVDQYYMATLVCIVLVIGILCLSGGKEDPPHVQKVQKIEKRLDKADDYLKEAERLLEETK